MFPKNIKLILAIALLGYGIYQITETYIGNGIFMFLLSTISQTCNEIKKITNFNHAQ